MATFKTKAQLSAAVLEQMNEVGVGQSVDPDEAALIEERYDWKLAEWRDRGLVWWANTTRSAEEIPLQVFQPLVDLMENEVMHSFGRDNPMPQRKAMEEQLLVMLRRAKAPGRSGESTSFSVY